MAKKKSNLNAILPFVAVVLGVVAVFMLFLDCLKYGGKDSTATFTGFQSIFGYTSKDKLLGTTVSTKLLSFSFLGLIALLAVVLGCVFSVVPVKLGKLLSVICFVIAAVLFFVFKSTVVLPEKTLLSKEYFTVLAPVYVAAVCSLLAALTNGYTLIKK